MATGSDLSQTLDRGSEAHIDTYCSSCLKDGLSEEANTYCMECKMDYCEKCQKHHNKFPSMQGHRIVDIAGPWCKTHNRQLFDKYCEYHDEVCCDACISIDHRRCGDVHYLPDISKGIKDSNEYKDTKKSVIIVMDQLKKAETEKLENISSLELDNKLVLETINQQENNLKNKITTLAQNAREQLRSKYAGIKTELEENINDLQTKIKDIESSEELFTNGTEDEIYLKVKSSKKSVKNSRALLSDLSKQRMHVGLSFFPNIILNTELDTLGTVVEEEKMQAKEYSATLIESHKMNEDAIMVTTACILGEKTLIIYDNTNYCLMRLDLKTFVVIDTLYVGTYFLYFFGKHGRLSYSLCSTGSEEVAIALYTERIVQFVSIQKTMTLINSFSTDHTCNGIAFNEVSEQIFVTDGAQQVKVYEKTGKLTKTYEKDVFGNSLFSRTRNVAFSNDKSTIYVTDWEKGLLALSRSGELRWLYTDPEISGVRGICVLPGDVILVSGVHSHNIIQVDKHGKKLGTLLGTKDNLNEPRTIVYAWRTSRLIVGQKSDKMLVYSLAQSHIL